MNKPLIGLILLSVVLFIVGFLAFAPMAHDGDTLALQEPNLYDLEQPLSTLTPVVFRDAVMTIDDLTYDVRFTGTVVHVDDYEHSLPLEWDAGFIAEIDDEQYIVCPHGLNAEGLWWGYVVPTSDTETIHCENDPEPLRITTVPSED